MGTAGGLARLRGQVLENISRRLPSTWTHEDVTNTKRDNGAAEQGPAESRDLLEKCDFEEDE